MDSPSQQNLNQLPVGTVLGDFKITGIVGEGGFGIVYLAYEGTLDRTVAIKEYLPVSIAGRTGDRSVMVRSQLNTDAFTSGLKNFLREAQMLAKFSHPALVEVHRVWEQNSTAYMAMRFYAGKTLRELYRGSQSLDEQAIRRIIEPIFDALSLLHGQSVIHRDVSPDNILMRANGAPVLLDLGAARLVVGGMTQALTTVLKPGYAPIEQYVDDGTMHQGPWTDVYGLGAVLYFLLAGAAPPQAVARMITDPLPGLVAALNASCSPEFVTGLIKSLAVRPENRFQSVEALREGLGWTEPLDNSPKTEFVRRAAPGVTTKPDSAAAPVVHDDATVVWTGGAPSGLVKSAPAAAATVMGNSVASAPAAVRDVPPIPANSVSETARTGPRPLAGKNPADATPAPSVAGGTPADFRPARAGHDGLSKRNWTGPIAAVIVAAIAAAGYLAFRPVPTPVPTPAAAPSAATDASLSSGASSAPSTQPGAAPTATPVSGSPTTSAGNVAQPAAAVTTAIEAKPASKTPADTPSTPSADAKAKAARDEAAAAKAKRDAEEKAQAKLDAQEKLAAQAKLKAEAEERAKRRSQLELEQRNTAAPTRAETEERARKAQQEEEERLAVVRARQEEADRQARAAAAKSAAPIPAPKRIEELSAQAMAAYRRGETLAARTLWTEIVTHAQATSGDKALAYNNMAISYCQNGDESNCERMYMAALRADRSYQVGAGERESSTFKRAYERALRAVRGQY